MHSEGRISYPGYNFTCNQQCWAIIMMPGIYGAVNDKKIVKTDDDDDVEKVRSDILFTEYSYSVNRDGSLKLMKSGYLIVDGGYSVGSVCSAD